MLIGIVGCGCFGREIMPLVDESIRRAQVDAKLVFVETAPRGDVNGYPVITEQEFLDQRKYYKTFNISVSNSKAREEIAKRFIEAGARPELIKSPQATFYSANKIGEGAIFCAGSIITSNVTIGRFFHCNLQSYVGHDCVIGDFVTFAPRVACNGNVVIEDHAYIGTGAVIRQGLRIGKGAVVGMGAVVTKDVPAGETWVGNPAGPISAE